MKRRRFLKISVAGGTLALGSSALLVSCSKPGAPPPQGLQSLFPDDERLIQLGRSYREAYPEEDDVDVLRELTASVEDSSLGSEAIRRDFESGNTVQLDGWILSRTEARLCALHSIPGS